SSVVVIDEVGGIPVSRGVADPRIRIAAENSRRRQLAERESQVREAGRVGRRRRSEAPDILAPGTGDREVDRQRGFLRRIIDVDRNVVDARDYVGRGLKALVNDLDSEGTPLAVADGARLVDRGPSRPLRATATIEGVSTDDTRQTLQCVVSRNGAA